MTEAEIIDGVLKREGGYVDHPHDAGGPTHFGVTARTLGEWRRLGRPATRAEVQTLQVEEARAIYEARYLRPFAGILSPPLRALLVDFGVIAGPATAIRALQAVLVVDVDGVIGPQTLAAVLASPSRLLVNALVAARCKHHSDLAERRPTDRTFLRGWIVRAVSFLMD